MRQTIMILICYFVCFFFYTRYNYWQSVLNTYSWSMPWLHVCVFSSSLLCFVCSFLMTRKSIFQYSSRAFVDGLYIFYQPTVDCKACICKTLSIRLHPFLMAKKQMKNNKHDWIWVYSTYTSTWTILCNFYV